MCIKESWKSQVFKIFLLFAFCCGRRGLTLFTTDVVTRTANAAVYPMRLLQKLRRRSWRRFFPWSAGAVNCSFVVSGWEALRPLRGCGYEVRGGILKQYVEHGEQANKADATRERAQRFSLAALERGRKCVDHEPHLSVHMCVQTPSQQAGHASIRLYYGAKAPKL